MNQATIDYKTDIVWENLCEIYSGLVRFNPPKIVLCNRLTRTAGKNYQDENRIHLGNKFFAKNQREMLKQILPHEIIHQADYNLFGISEKKCGHGKKWVEMMVKYGLEPLKYHGMTI